jgi:hypothetical protein
MGVLKRLWSEDAGFVISTEAIIILTMLICAAVVGWQAVRLAVLSELADVAEAIAALDQSYSFAGFTGHAASCSGSIFTDNRDFCDDADCVGEDGGFGRCIALVDPVKEDAVAVPGSGDSGA